MHVPIRIKELTQKSKVQKDRKTARIVKRKERAVIERKTLNIIVEISTQRR